MKKHFTTGLFTALLFAGGCSSDKNTWTSKSFHNINAHYNGYYYANEEIIKIEKTILRSNQDDYNKILRLFPTFDSTMAKGYEKELEEAIKMASIAITRHPNSKWVDDAYILVGKARLYSLDWGNAIQTFKYVNTKSEDANARHRAIINLIRTFTEHREYNNAQAAIDFLLKEKLNKRNKKDFYLEKAYYHQELGDYDNMVRSLTTASPLLKKKDRSGRVYFIIGQVYQELGFEAEAFNFYKKCLSTHPEYETDFYARLYMAQVAEISRSRDISAARKSFKRLLKDSKNRDFKDKIYYELGTFELKQKNITPAITNLNYAIREGSNRNVDGEAYLRLGEIYYDTLKNYELSQAYYDSAIGALPKDYENYTAIKSRQEILNEFVKNLKTVQWQDSLLHLSKLDTAALRIKVDSAVTARKKLEELLAKGKKHKKKSNRVELQPTETNIFNAGEETSETGVWYFGNPSAVSIGQNEFKRVWGDIKLEDNWRRSFKASVGSVPGQGVAATNQDDAKVELATDAPTVAVDPVETELANLRKEIPYTDEQKSEALKKIEDAYFRLGDIYYFNLLEKGNALSYYQRLLSRFPESDYTAEVLYKMYLITKETNPEKAETYADMIKKDHPNSTYAKILLNPEYLREASQATEKQKEIYKNAYESYIAEKYVDALQLIEEAQSLGQTLFTPNLELLKMLIIGKTRDLPSYQTALKDFISTNPDIELIPYAQKLLELSEKFNTSEKTPDEITFTIAPATQHYFIITYKRRDKVGDLASRILEDFNKANYKDTKLKTSNLVLNEDLALTMVGDFENQQAANTYYKRFKDKLPGITELQSRDFNMFIISNENFNIFYRTKGLVEYLSFFKKNYEKENQ